MPDRGTPPALGVWLLGRICRPRYRDIVEGDLLELYARRERIRGWPYASLRYLADVASLTRTSYSHTHKQRNSISDPDRGLVVEMIMTLLQDLRHAGRSLLKTPAFSLVVVLTLGLAIGANSAIFSVVDGVLLKPLPFEEPGSIVLLNERLPDGGDDGPMGTSQSLYLEWRERGRSFEQLAMYSNEAATLTSLEEPVRMNGARVSPSLFPLLRVDARHGRAFGADEERPGADDVVLLAHRTWQRLFGGDPAVVGQRIELDSAPRTVIGVMPPGFGFPDAGAEYWVPMLATPPTGSGEDAAATAARQGASVRQSREVRRGAEGEGGGEGPESRDGGGGGGPEAHMELFARVVGRLAPGVTPSMAAEEGTRLARGLNAMDTVASERTVEVVSMQEQMVGSVRRSLLTLLGAVGFVLLIACANVANLVMARSVERRKETAVRAALGAGWWSLARLLFLESMLLAASGAILGLSLAWIALRALAAAGPEFIPRLDAVAVDTRALLFTLLVTGTTAVLFSVVPARRARRLELTSALKEEFGGSGLTAGLGRDALRRLLVTVEVAASVVLLVGAGLLVASFLRLTSVDMGYDVDNLLTLQIQLPQTAYPDAASHLDYYDRLVEQLEGLQGVEAATVTSRPPNLPANVRVAISVQTSDEPQAVDARPPEPVGVRMVENGYFDALRASSLDGRFISRDDRPETQAVAVMSESGARAMFGESDPLGQRLDFLGGQELEIVGIARDVRVAGVDPAPQPDIFLPYRQAPQRMVPMLFRTANVLVRTGPAPLSVLPAVRGQLRQIDPSVVLLTASTMRDQLSESVAEPRFYASLVAAFALLALILAAVGIYGLLSYTVQQGVRDTAIRRALGAPVGQILRGVVAQGMVMAAVGLVIGAGAALALGRVLESMLYEISPTDPTSFVVVALVFLSVALLAVWVPARRATRIDPMDVLRYE